MNAGTSDIALKLRSMPLFGELGPDELDQLSRMMTYHAVPKGACIISQREQGGCMYFLSTGRVKVSLASPDGKELALNYLDAPAYFGEMSLVDSEPRSADVIAVTDVEVLGLAASNLTAVIQVQPKLAVSLIATMSRRLRQTITRLEDLAFHDARHRVIRVLLNVATASYEARGIPVVSGLTHYEIATLAGTSRETASRIISALIREGVIATKGRRIVVDLLRLRERLHSD